MFVGVQLRELREDEAIVLKVACNAFMTDLRDPSVEYLRWKAREQGLARTTAREFVSIIEAMPSIGAPELERRYGPLSVDPNAFDAGIVKVTPLGVALNSKNGLALTDAFFEAVRFIGRRAEQAKPNFSIPSPLQVSGSEIRELFQTRASPEDLTKRVLKLLSNDNFLTHFVSGSIDGNLESITYRFGIDADVFTSVESIAEYFDALCLLYPGRRTYPTTRPVNPLELLSSFDYFNAVWRLASSALDVKNRPLFSLPSAELVGRLLYDCDTAEELESRLSGISQLLKIEAPKGSKDSSEHPLMRMKPVLQKGLPAAGFESCATAIQILCSVVSLRNGAQHASAAGKASRAAKHLGLTYPIVEFNATWNTVRTIVIESLAVLRDEISSLSNAQPE